MDTPVSHGSELGQLGLLDCATGREGFESNGLAVLAPEIANATTPYHVSPVFVVETDMVSELSGFGAMAYHSWMNCPPPMPSCEVLGVNVNPAVSSTENAEPPGKQSHPTMITSGPVVVVSPTEQEVT